MRQSWKAASGERPCEQRRSLRAPVMLRNVANEQGALPPKDFERRARFFLSPTPSSLILALPGILLGAICLVPFLRKGFND